MKRYRVGLGALMPALMSALMLTGVLRVAGGGVATAAEPVRTEPGHLSPPPDVDPHYERFTPTWNAKQPQVVFRDQKEWRKGGKMERTLSLACRDGAFTELRPMQFRALFSDDVLGVAFGHGLNLHDSRHLAKPDQIYLFHYAGTTACEVLSRPNLDPAAASSTVR